MISDVLSDAESEPDEPLDETPIKERPQDKMWLIWSNEHGKWWKPSGRGYTPRKSDAGRYPFENAIGICQRANFHLEEHAAPKETMIPED